MRFASVGKEPHPFETTTLGATGTYTLVFDPGASVTGTADFRFYAPAEQLKTTTINGAPVPVAISGPGGSARITFTTTATERIKIDTTAGTLRGCGAIRLFPPTGSTEVGSSSGCFNSSGVAEWNYGIAMDLTAIGTYNILVDPEGTEVGQTSVRVYRSP